MWACCVLAVSSNSSPGWLIRWQSSHWCPVYGNNTLSRPPYQVAVPSILISKATQIAAATPGRHNCFKTSQPRQGKDKHSANGWNNGLDRQHKYEDLSSSLMNPVSVCQMRMVEFEFGTELSIYSPNLSPITHQSPWQENKVYPKQSQHYAKPHHSNANNFPLLKVRCVISPMHLKMHSSYGSQLVEHDIGIRLSLLC